jgi:hypothetical protein
MDCEAFSLVFSIVIMKFAGASQWPSMDFTPFRNEVFILKSQIGSMSLTVTPSQNQPPPPSPATSQPSQPITSTPCQKQALPPSPAALHRQAE